MPSFKMGKDYIRQKKKVKFEVIFWSNNDSAELNLFLSRSNFINRNLSAKYQ